MPLLTKRLIQVVLPFTRINKTVLPPVVACQTRNYAARKGTRERKAKLKVKVEEKKVDYVPYKIRKEAELAGKRPSKKFDDSWKRLPTDDVYAFKFYQWRTYTFEEAVQAHRDTHHPEIYNQPNAYLHLTIDLNMSGEKKNRYIENFTRICKIPHPFEHGEERSVVVFTKTPEMVQELRQQGATLAGGPELIKQFQGGSLSLQDFQYVLAHPNILPELTVLRGVMKRKFPNVRLGNLDVNLVEALQKFLHGINYSAIKDEHEKDFGQIITRIGTLNMDPKHLEENFAAFLTDVHDRKPRRSGTFITRAILWSPPSGERLKVNHNLYLSTEKENEDTKEEEQEDEETPEVAENERAVAT